MKLPWKRCCLASRLNEMKVPRVPQTQQLITRWLARGDCYLVVLDRPGPGETVLLVKKNVDDSPES